MIADSLRRFRDSLGYSQGGLAESVGMKQTTWSGWENNPPEALRLLVLLSDRYGVSIDYILGITDNPKRTDSVADLSPDAQQMISALGEMTTLQQSATLRIAQIITEVENQARTTAIRELALISMSHIKNLLGVEAAEDFYQAVDLFRRTGDSSALTAWLSTHLGDDELHSDDE